MNTAGFVSGSMLATLAIRFNKAFFVSMHFAKWKRHGYVLANNDMAFKRENSKSQWTTLSLNEPDIF